MSSTLRLDQMTTEEKLIAMEELWADLTRNQKDFKSPAWHGSVLKQRDQRLRNGLEEPTDWDEAKGELRRRFK